MLTYFVGFRLCRVSCVGVIVGWFVVGWRFVVIVLRYTIGFWGVRKVLLLLDLVLGFMFACFVGCCCVCVCVCWLFWVLWLFVYLVF